MSGTGTTTTSVESTTERAQTAPDATTTERDLGATVSLEVTGAASAAADAPTIDGRSLRRLRNRERVLDAYLELVTAGNRNPTVDDLARYSGISFRSIYRYFSSTTELVADATNRGLAQFRRDISVADEGSGPLDERVSRLVDQRLALYRRAAPFISAARSSHFDDERALSLFTELRQTLTEQLGRHFAPELESLDDDERQRRVISIYVTFLYDSMSLLTDLYGDDDQAIREFLNAHVRRQLA